MSGALGQPLGAGVPLPGGEPVQGAPRPNGLAGAPDGAPRPGAPMAGGTPPMADGAPTGPQGAFPATPSSAHATLLGAHGAAKANFDITSKAIGQIDVVRKALQRLANKQDMVTQDDIIDEAGKLVGHGIDPRALAGLLADMPQEGGGEALGGWVATHAITAAAAEQHLLMAHALARHQLGVSAMHMLMAHAAGMHPGGIANASTPPDGGNALAAMGAQGTA